MELREKIRRLAYILPAVVGGYGLVGVLRRKISFSTRDMGPRWDTLEGAGAVAMGLSLIIFACLIHIGLLQKRLYPPSPKVSRFLERLLFMIGFVPCAVSGLP